MRHLLKHTPKNEDLLLPPHIATTKRCFFIIACRLSVLTSFFRGKQVALERALPECPNYFGKVFQVGVRNVPSHVLVPFPESYESWEPEKKKQEIMGARIAKFPPTSSGQTFQKQFQDHIHHPHCTTQWRGQESSSAAGASKWQA